MEFLPLLRKTACFTHLFDVVKRRLYSRGQGAEGPAQTVLNFCKKQGVLVARVTEAYADVCH